MIKGLEGTLVITSSLKDVMTLYSIGIPAIAFQSETTMPDENIVEQLKSRFNCIILFYDTDLAGQTMAERICGTFGFLNVKLDEDYASKDISDFIANEYVQRGKEWRINHIKELIHSVQSHEKIQEKTKKQES